MEYLPQMGFELYQKELKLEGMSQPDEVYTKRS